MSPFRTYELHKFSTQNKSFQVRNFHLRFWNAIDYHFQDHQWEMLADRNQVEKTDNSNYDDSKRNT